MRDLQECQAEIFRRSEKRIKDRRQRRNHILTACIPLVLGICAFSMFALPKNSGGAKPQMEGQQSFAAESISNSVLRIEVSGFGYCRSYTETSQVQRICGKLNACKDRDVLNDQNAEQMRGEDDTQSTQEVDNSASKAAYTITLVADGGKEHTYSFSGCILKDLTANQAYILSQKQVKELEEVLGISAE